MVNTEFIPVLLGSDTNVYGMARAFHQAYNIKSIAVSKTVLTATVDTKIIDFEFEKDLDNPTSFVKKLIEVAKKHPQKKLLLVPCGDGYVKLLVKNAQELSAYYEFNCLSEEHLNMLTLKEEFYKTCDKYGFSYPKTQVITKDNAKSTKLEFSFPVIVKASNSVEYWKCDFIGKRKVFVAAQLDEYNRIIDAIYHSSYQDSLTIQEFIPGDDTKMRVLNCYSNKQGKVMLMALGHALLEDHTPQGIGSYTAIINTYDEQLLTQFKTFLESIGYTGFSNFDMKYDCRDGKYKFFETNPRQGRSSFYVTASGENLAKWLADDVIFHKKQEFTIAKNEHLWLQVPKQIVYKYISDPILLKKVKSLVKQGKFTNSLFYDKDLSFKRYIKLKLANMNHYNKYKKYYGKKGLEE
ncbi:MAG: ATP-grasp domain-containing protein [Oscillospiraceae bacterium]